MMDSIGGILKKKREELRLSIEDVSRRTKIHVNSIRALENDEYEGISPIYIKGFLKIYGRLLHLDENELLQKFNALKKEEQAVFEFNKHEDDLKAAQECVVPSLPKKDFLPVLLTAAKIIGVLLVVFVAFILPFKVVKLFQKQEKPKIERKVSKPVVKSASVTNKKPEVIPLKRMDMLSLSMMVKSDSWVKVKVDGKTVFQNILKRGKTENWKAKNKIELSLGDAGATEIEINGKHISGLGRKGQVINSVVITKDGVRVLN